jgi:diguanylate cyclase (GGDEF)-like protein
MRGDEPGEPVSRTVPKAPQRHTLIRSALVPTQPLQALPSLLALGDVRQHAGAPATAGTDPVGALAAKLSLDPLVTLRALRLVRAPMHAQKGLPRTLRQLVQNLGSAATGRLFDVQSVAPAGTEALRHLWHHTVARACAAELLAQETGILDPEEAYFQALFHDLDDWLHHLGVHQTGVSAAWSGVDLVRQWGLGVESFVRCGDAAWTGRDPVVEAQEDPSRLAAIATSLATTAGFPHPDRSCPPLDAQGQAAHDYAVLIEETVRERFAHFGIPLEFETNALAEFAMPTGKAPATSLDPELVSRLLACRTALSIQGLETVSVAAAIRYLDYDRAFILGWSPELRRVWVRSKADLTRLRLHRNPVRPTEREAEILAKAHQTRRPGFLVRGGASEGLCDHLGTDRALIVPLDHERESPRFLVLDRVYSARPLSPDQELIGVPELGGFMALLFDNLGLRLRQRRAERAATLDTLTGLANRGVGIFSLEREIASAKRRGAPLCVMMLDLDDFKQLNDRLGHLVGDQALRIAASVLRRTVRSSDTVCRYGGEEFLAILPQTSTDEATILATRLFTEVADAGNQSQLPLTVSIGLSSLRPGDTLDSLVARADHALYVSKSRGRNRFSVDTD